MIYILMIVLAIMLIIEIYINKYSILAPGCVTIEVFMISVFIAMINVGNWGNFQLKTNTFLVIVGGILAFCIGEFIFNKIFDRTFYKCIKQDKEYLFNPDLQDRIPWIAIIIISIILLISIFLRYKRTCELASMYGVPNGFRETVRMAKNATNQPGVTYGRTLNLLGMIANASYLVFGYILLKHIVEKTFRKTDLLYLIPIVLSIITLSVVPGRLQYIALISAALMMFYVIYICRHEMTIRKAAIFAICAASALLLFFVVFVFMGKYGSADNSITYVFSYTGSSIYDLNDYLNREVPVEAGRFGQETLYGVYNILRHFVDGIEEIVPHLEYAEGGTNIYTAFRRLIHDYGIIGMVVIEMLMGAFYTCIYRYASEKDTAPLWVIAWGYFSHGLVHQSIDDLLLTEMLGSQTVYMIVFVLLIILLIVLPDKLIYRNK